MNIRSATRADQDVLFNLVERFAMSFTPERAAFETSLAHILADESVWLGVAEINGRVVAYCLGFVHTTFYANGRVAWIEELMVQADFRRQGIGRALIVAFEEWARGRDCKLIALATRRAQPFYAALGYEESALYFRKVFEDSNES